VGLDVAGIDVVAEDLSRPLEDQRGGIVEVNAGPGLRMHLEPSAGHPRDVGSAIVDSLFPSGQTGRIPVIAVTGVNGKTTTTRLIAHVLRHAGQKVGMTSTDGMYLEGRRTDTHDCSGPQSARAVLLNPNIEVAVLETARGGILREGLAFEHCDVGIVTNIGKGDHLGLRGIDTLEELAQVKRVVIEAVAPNGAAVLNATDPLVAQMASFCPGQVIWFATDPATPVLANGLAQRGDRAVTVRNHEIVLLDGTSTIALLPIRDIPLTQPNELPFQVENVLATAAALWQIGIELETIRSGLRSFHGPDMEAPSRFNVIESHGRTVILDYAHNPSAVFAMATAVERFPPGHRTLVTTGSNRLDADLIEMGEIIGNTFDRVVLYDDCGHSGRTDGELNEILKVGLGRGQRVKHIVEKPTEREAIDVVLRGLEAGQLAVFGVEALEDSLSYVQTFLQGWVSYL
jgi:cyanophycin synthetase